MTDFRVCLVTLPDRETARKIAENIVNAKLCACANLIPGLESVYTWQGKVETSAEILMVIKTQQSCVAALDARIRELHPYSVYEFIVLPILYGNTDYLQWIKEATS
ncbi:MAG: cation tolerance protein CutA [Candidatus Riflebacteria bacterium GWC2_50_8]|nr:MAG: cation tolerance protein CutA [Candidatus Riflebacteria bacterium GWC2_50_8]